MTSSRVQAEGRRQPREGQGVPGGHRATTTPASGRSSSSGPRTSPSSARPRSPSSASATATSGPRRAGAGRQHRHEFVHLAWRNDHPDLKDLPFPMLADTKRELVDGARHPAQARRRARCARRSSSIRRASSATSASTTCRRPQRRRGAARARRAADRRALPLQLAEGRADAGGGLTWHAARRARATPLPERRRSDIKLNLQAVLAAGQPDAGAALGGRGRCRRSRRATRALRDAVLADARAEVDAAVVDDALAAAALMAMNNVYYRFRHMVGKPSLLAEAGAPAHEPDREAGHEQGRLRAVLPGGRARSTAARRACRRTRRSCCEGGLTEDQVHDAVRIAATVHAAAVALEMGEVQP